MASFKAFIIALMILIGFASESSAQESDVFIWPSPEHSVLDIQFVDSTLGRILSESREGYYLSTTTDGGRTWRSARISPPIRKIFFLDNRLGWGLFTIIDRNKYHFTHLVRTQDGGQKWETIFTFEEGYHGVRGMITDLLFFDSNRGVIVGRGSKTVGEGIRAVGIIHATKNGGEAFDSITLPVHVPDMFVKLVVAKPEKLWVLGRNYVLHNDGITPQWSVQISEGAIPDERYEILLDSGVMFDDGTGWLVGTSQATGIVIGTKNGGRTWTVGLEADQTVSLTDISYIDKDHVCTVGLSTNIYCTDDGGQTWNSRDVLPSAHFSRAINREIAPSKNDFDRIVLLPSGRGWVKSSGGYIYQTEDGGSTWNEMRMEQLIPKETLRVVPPTP